MKFCTIASGSKGNMTYIESNNTKILLDVGISLREAKNRTTTQNIDFKNINAIIISHEHIDHVRFLPTFIKHTDAVLYISKLSFDNLNFKIKSELVNRRIVFIEENKRYKINDIDVLTLELSHDSAAAFGFIFIGNNKRLASLTDTGFLPVKYINILKEVDALIIEANHDVQMLMECNRPLELKHRILSPKGHMSNHICLQVLLNVLNERHKIVMLAHISEECNSIDIIQNEIIFEVEKIYNGEILIASQFEASKIFKL